jgi:CRISPR-associated protein Csy1
VYCTNDAFQKEREKLNWLDVIAADFAHWLIKQLKHEDKYLLGDVEHAYFSKLCLHHLKRFEQTTPKLGEL